MDNILIELHADEAYSLFIRCEKPALCFLPTLKNNTFSKSSATIIIWVKHNIGKYTSPPSPIFYSTKKIKETNPFCRLNHDILGCNHDIDPCWFHIFDPCKLQGMNTDSFPKTVLCILLKFILKRANVYSCYFSLINTYWKKRFGK